MRIIERYIDTPLFMKENYFTFWSHGKNKKDIVNMEGEVHQPSGQIHPSEDITQCNASPLDGYLISKFHKTTLILLIRLKDNCD